MENILSNPKLLIPLIFSLIGLLLSIIGIFNYRKAKKSMNWITTTATIISSEVITKKNSDSAVVYTPEICYSFKVQGEEYFSNRIRFLSGYESNSSAKAYEVTKKYPANSQVTIYYNPLKPKDSVIEPGVKTENIVFLVIGLALLVIPLVVAYFLNFN